MKKSGGIIALIGGIFGTLAAIVTLFFGGLGAALEADGGTTVIAMGWIGGLAAFLSIIIGAVAMGSKGKVPGILLIICAVLGAIFGGTIVAICMILTLAGGVMALFGNKNTPATKES
jgi:hypothetical protein